MTSRLKLLEQRSARSAIGVSRFSDGWWVGSSRDFCGPFKTRREAIHRAYHWSINPLPKLRIWVDGVEIK